VEELLKNKLGLQVLTDTGWSNFEGLAVKGNKQTVEVKTQSRSIKCTLTHRFFDLKLNYIEARRLRPGTKIQSSLGIDTVVSVTLKDIVPVYDLFNVEKNHRFYANNLLVKNCEFIIFDETLINPLHLTELSGVDPIEKQGQVRWYKKPSADHTYLVALDPSLGTGSDPAAIQVFELPGMKQVAEWSHNKTPVQRQIVILKEICQYLADAAGVNNVYYSLENNTLGEAALVALEDIGEENIDGIFLSEPKRLGTTRRYRKGFNTTNRSKLAACAKFKSLVETKRIQIYSKLLISELKVFVASGQSYAAKIGEHDDLVMAVLLIIRMVQLLQNYDSSLDDELRDNAEKFIEPMPFIALF
jgi:hypothetical protein